MLRLHSHGHGLGRLGGEALSSDDVVETMRANSEKFKTLIMDTLPLIPEERICGCGEALSQALL